MQTIFEVYDDEGTVSYLHMGDEDKPTAKMSVHSNVHNDSQRSLYELNGQAHYLQNKAVLWSQNDLRPATLFPLLNKSVAPQFKPFV